MVGADAPPPVVTMRVSATPVTSVHLPPPFVTPRRVSALFGKSSQSSASKLDPSTAQLACTPEPSALPARSLAVKVSSSRR